MRALEQHRKMDRGRRNIGALLSVACALVFGLTSFTTAFAGQHGGGYAPAPHMQAPHASAPHPQAPPRQQQPHPQSAPQQMHPQTVPQAQPHFNTAPQFNSNAQQFNNRPTQPGHLPEWLNNHQNMTPQQRENALRQEPASTGCLRTSSSGSSTGCTRSTMRVRSSASGCCSGTRTSST